MRCTPASDEGERVAQSKGCGQRTIINNVTGPVALAGAAAGLLSGTGGALIYTLHCTEMAAPFLAIWYLLGILIPAAVGALLGPRLLRW